MSHLWDPLIISTINSLVRPLHLHENTLAPVLRCPFTYILNIDGIHYQNLLINLEILIMRICTYLENMKHEFVTIADIFLASQRLS